MNTTKIKINIDLKQYKKLFQIKFFFILRADIFTIYKQLYFDTYIYYI